MVTFSSSSEYDDGETRLTHPRTTANHNSFFRFDFIILLPQQLKGPALFSRQDIRSRAATDFLESPEFLPWNYKVEALPLRHTATSLASLYLVTLGTALT